MRSRSRMMQRGASFQGNASVICRATQSAVGYAVTLVQTRSLRPSRLNDESIEQVETDGRNNEQVHCGNVQRVIMQEGPPSLARQTSPFDHVLGDARLC